jgi:hypothetical protein
MPFIGLLYVSESCLAPEHAAAEIDRIMSVSIVRNAALDVNGALLFTGTFFAQRLEGPVEAVSQLMKSIEADSRHRNVRIIDNAAIATRKFSRWSMAYNGPSKFIERHIDRIFRSPDKTPSPTEVHRLIRIMLEFQRD